MCAEAGAMDCGDAPLLLRSALASLCSCFALLLLRSALALLLLLCCSCFAALALLLLLCCSCFAALALLLLLCCSCFVSAHMECALLYRVPFGRGERTEESP